MTNIDFDFQKDDLVISIFLFMPMLIPLFLPFFYGNPLFFIRFLSKGWLESSYFYVYKNNKVILSEFSKLMKEKKTSRENYASALFEYLSTLTYEQIDKVYKVELNFQPFKFMKSKYEVNIVEFKFLSVSEVKSGFSKEKYYESQCFLNKLNFDLQLKCSLNQYEVRRQKKKYIIKNLT